MRRELCFVLSSGKQNFARISPAVRLRSAELRVRQNGNPPHTGCVEMQSSAAPSLGMNTAFHQAGRFRFSSPLARASKYRTEPSDEENLASPPVN